MGDTTDIKSLLVFCGTMTIKLKLPKILTQYNQQNAIGNKFFGAGVGMNGGGLTFVINIIISTGHRGKN